jgi:hypothetical protein
MLSFGIFQGYYTDAAGYSPSDVSWVGTIGLFLAYFISGFSGRALDAGHYRAILVCGLTLQLISVFTTSVSTAYWQLFLSQGICSGIGNGLLFCPAVALVSTYFSSRRRAAAVSLVACGGGTGGMVFPAIAQSLLPKIGFAWTVRAMGFVMLFNAVLVLLFSRTRLPPRKSGPLIDWDSLREPSYVSFCVGVFFVFLGLFFAYYYIRPFSRGTPARFRLCVLQPPSHPEWHGRPRPIHSRPTFRPLFGATEHDYSTCHILWSTHIFLGSRALCYRIIRLGRGLWLPQRRCTEPHLGGVFELHPRLEEEWRQDGHRTYNCKLWLSERSANRRPHYTAPRRRLPPGTDFRRYRYCIWKSTAPVCETFADRSALKAASLK